MKEIWFMVAVEDDDIDTDLMRSKSVEAITKACNEVTDYYGLLSLKMDSEFNTFDERLEDLAVKDKSQDDGKVH